MDIMRTSERPKTYKEACQICPEDIQWDDNIAIMGDISPCILSFIKLQTIGKALIKDQIFGAYKYHITTNYSRETDHIYVSYRTTKTSGFGTMQTPEEILTELSMITQEGLCGIPGMPTQELAEYYFEQFKDLWKDLARYQEAAKKIINLYGRDPDWDITSITSADDASMLIKRYIDNLGGRTTVELVGPMPISVMGKLKLICEAINIVSRRSDKSLGLDGKRWMPTVDHESGKIIAKEFIPGMPSCYRREAAIYCGERFRTLWEKL